MSVYDEELLEQLDDVIAELKRAKDKIYPERSRWHGQAVDQLDSAIDRVKEAIITLESILDNADRR